MEMDGVQETVVPASLSGCQERLEDLAQGLQDFLTKEFSESVAPRLRDLAVTLDNLNGYLKEVDEKSEEEQKEAEKELVRLRLVVDQFQTKIAATLAGAFGGTMEC